MASLSNKSNRDKIIKDNSDPTKGISLVIPRVFSNVSWQRIRQVFIDLKWGFVERVDIIPVKGRNFKRSFVHFAPGKWNTRNPEAMEVLDALRNGSQVKIVYHEPWFWKVSISRAKRPEATSKNNNNNAERKKRRKDRANAAQKRINNTRKQNAGRRKKCKTRRRRRIKKK